MVSAMSKMFRCTQCNSMYFLGKGGKNIKSDTTLKCLVCNRDLDFILDPGHINANEIKLKDLEKDDPHSTAEYLEFIESKLIDILLLTEIVVANAPLEDHLYANEHWLENIRSVVGKGREHVLDLHTIRRTIYSIRQKCDY